MNKLTKALPNFGSSILYILAQENFVTVSTLILRRLLSACTSFKGQGLEKETLSDLERSRLREFLVMQRMICGVQIPSLSHSFCFLSTIFSF